jgi:hypothetical protein
MKRIAASPRRPFDEKQSKMMLFDDIGHQKLSRSRRTMKKNGGWSLFDRLPKGKMKLLGWNSFKRRS